VRCRQTSPGVQSESDGPPGCSRSECRRSHAGTRRNMLTCRLVVDDHLQQHRGHAQNCQMGKHLHAKPSPHEGKHLHVQARQFPCNEDLHRRGLRRVPRVRWRAARPEGWGQAHHESTHSTHQFRAFEKPSSRQPPRRAHVQLAFHQTTAATRTARHVPAPAPSPATLIRFWIGWSVARHHA